jgi:hypothetical protein
LTYHFFFLFLSKGFFPKGRREKTIKRDKYKASEAEQSRAEQQWQNDNKKR